MSEITFVVVITFFIVLLQGTVCADRKKCGELELYPFLEDTIFVSENDSVNISFWVNTLSCQRPNNDYYVVELQTRTSDGKLEYDGRVVQWNNKCSVTQQKSVRCITEGGPAQLYREMNRSHIQIEWSWTWKDSESQRFRSAKKELKLNVSYPARVTHLTVDGHEISVNTIIEEGQEVNITCSFDKGSPPVSFRLLDESGNEPKLTRQEGHLHYRLVANGCEDYWRRPQSLQCEGSGSKQNRSVLFFVSCPPRFVERSTIIVRSLEATNVTLAITSHTTALDRCQLTSLSLGYNSSKEVNCSILGSPPHLVLTLHFDKEDKTILGKWTLTVRNDKGTANATLIFNDADTPKQQQSQLTLMTRPSSRSRLQVKSCFVCFTSICFISYIQYFLKSTSQKSQRSLKALKFVHEHLQ